ncbi:MAG: lipase family protein [Actinomycetales bacterium]
MRRLRRVLIWFVVIALTLAALATGTILVQSWQTDQRQATLEAFYTPPDPLPTQPGTVIRVEPLDVSVPGGTALRMLYVTQRPTGEPVTSGAMVFLPTAPAPSGGRPVVAWAHGTVGMGNACAPSRSTNPLSDTNNWLAPMLARGWAVVATDYAGLGTPGDELYLVAEAEARDVVNSVRTVRTLPQADAGSRYAVWGHSQGGHSSLWTGHLSEQLAPELSLVGVAAAAPAAELVDIMGAQWSGLVGWAIGPEVMVSWPVMDPNLDPPAIMTPAGAAAYRRLAQECTSSKVLAVKLVARTYQGKQFFVTNPISAPAWRSYAQEQTPPPLPASMPVFIAQGTADEVVLPWPNALLAEQWCKAGSAISMLWLGGVTHNAAAEAGGPAAVWWIADRFADRPAPRTCDQPPPIALPNQ